MKGRKISDLMWDVIVRFADICEIVDHHYLISLATVSLKLVSRKRRRKCTPKSYDRFTYKYFFYNLQ